MRYHLALITLLLLPAAAAQLTLDNVYFDPAIIAAGDEVDVIIEYSAAPVESVRVGDPDWRFQVRLEPDDERGERHLSIVDPLGDDLYGTVRPGTSYNKRFRVKVANDAPAGEYELRLVGQWVHDGDRSEEQFVRFRMPVKKEGIIMDVAQVTTLPAKVRAGDTYVELHVQVANAGFKDAKDVELSIDFPEPLTPATSADGRLWIGYVGAGDTEDAVVLLDVDPAARAHVADITYRLLYRDLDNNAYTRQETLPLRIADKPRIEVVEARGVAPAGGELTMTLTLENTGGVSAEAVDVRLLKESSQPFTLDARSAYVGEIEPGAQATAVLTFEVGDDAHIGEHDLAVLVRAKGDSDENDNTVYAFRRHASVEVTEREVHPWIIPAVLLAALVLVVAVALRRRKH